MLRLLFGFFYFKKPYLKKYIIILLFLLVQQKVFSQTVYEMTLENASISNNNTFEFDVFIKSVELNFTLTSYQCSFTFNIENSNNGTLSFSYISNTSQLSNTPIYGVSVNQSDGIKKLTFASGVGSDVISSLKKKVGRFRLQNSSVFTGQSFEINWSFNGYVNTILTGFNYSDITNPSYHTNLLFTNIDSPKLIGAELISADSVRLSFSKELNPLTANNSSNYNINNGISVTDAQLSSDGLTVIITSSDHTPGESYTIEVNNVEDLSGHPIDTTANSKQYTYTPNENSLLNIKVFLEGPFVNGSMNTGLQAMDFIPLSQPFNTSPWFYTGSENVASIPADIVDWVLIELRTETSSITHIKTCAAFIKKDGSVVNLDGTNLLKLTGTSNGNYYVIIRHRNHLAIMSSSKVIISDNPPLYDFTTGSDKAYGNNAQSDLGDGKYGMFSGDGNVSGSINNSDLNSVWKKENGKIGYYSGDFDLNAGVNIVDKNSSWKINNGKSSQVPN